MRAQIGQLRIAFGQIRTSVGQIELGFFNMNGERLDSINFRCRIDYIARDDELIQLTLEPPDRFLCAGERPQFHFARVQCGRNLDRQTVGKLLDVRKLPELHLCLSKEL